ncbi:Prostaglandin G/H synthase 1 [Acipenser ruthenus]|uniref:Prostaglandin G/H synthase 1 n=1 Tax=Acipenser ruthenus TaxID=7906 RepID=A0A444UXH1_ACIRT|nr:Prostaglandin G/H synthase 1 [Acipenser ruthenus]
MHPVGKVKLPDSKYIVEKFLLRKKFIPDPQGTNLMFAFFAQHFTHQFFKTHNRMGLGFTKALGHGVDAGHIYGDNLDRQLNLRLLKDGKMKYQLVNGDMYPPTVAEALVNMSYPPNVPLKNQLAIGQEVYGLLPGLIMYATIWLREHNRVCDILKAEHPTWSDEQLFQTTRLIIIGETIKIVIEDYVQHLSGYYLQLKFAPELLFDVQFQYRNRIAVEFNQLYHWHPLMPDSFIIDKDEYSYKDFLFNTSMITSYGVETLAEAFSKQIAGRLVNGDMYPPTVAEALVNMSYPPNVPLKNQLAIGQEVYGLLPGLIMYATIWLREHNRVCDILKAEHPTWSDEQLFQTTRLIIIGETIKIVIEDYVQHLSGYYLQLKFAPELLFDVQFQYRNRIAVEFNQLYHWHPLMPDSFIIDKDEYSYKDFLFNTSMITSYGVETLAEAFSKQIAGRIGGGHNINPHVLKVAAGVIEESRKLRLQPFNEYRKRFHLKPYKTFLEFVGGDEELAKELEELYGDIDALEFYPGLMLESPRPGAIFGESMVEMGAPFSLKGLLGNPICSPEYWKPSTFGGKTGFDIVNTASLKNLVCLNTKRCPYVNFHVPIVNSEDDGSIKKPSTEL